MNNLNISKDIKKIPLFEESTNNTTEIFTKAIYEQNKLQKFFFSKKNIEKLQQLLRYNVYIQSNKKHKIGYQDDTSLKIIMKSIYLQYSKNNSSNIKQQVQSLNNLVLDYSVSNILSNIEMYLVYKKNISNLPTPLNNPKYISNNGTKTNFIN